VVKTADARLDPQASTFGVHAFAKAVIASVTAAAAARIDRIAGSAFMFVSSFV
jgi:hypothetical protein